MGILSNKIRNLRKNMSKNKMIVQVSRSGSDLIKVVFSGRYTVADALEAAGLNVKSSEEIRVNKKVVDTDYELNNNDRVVLAKNVSGGSR